MSSDNIFLGYNNRADNATLSDGAWTGLANVKTQNFGLQAVSNTAAAADTRLRFDLGANYVIRALALANCTLGKNAMWRVRLGTAPMDMDFSGGVGDSRLTYAGGANGTRFNEIGAMEAAAAPRLDYDRTAYWNGFKSSEDLTAIGYTFNNARATDYRTVVFGDGTAFVAQSALNCIAGRKYVITGKVRFATGDDPIFTLRMTDGVGNQTSPDIVATDKWKRFRVEITPANTSMVSGAVLLIYHGLTTTPLSSTTFQFTELQIQTVPTNADELPYRKTTVNRLYRCLGILREEARTNLALRSSELDNAAWTKTGCTVTANVGFGVSGLQDLDRILEDTSTGPHFVSQPYVYANSSNHTLHCIATRNAGRDAFLKMDLTGGGWAKAFFNCATGAVTGLSTGGTNLFTNVQAYSILLADQFCWCILTATTPAAAGAGTFQVGAVNYALGTDSYTGDGINGVRANCVQLELGNTPSSHIPTGAATVLRTADAITCTGANFTSWYLQSIGTIYVEASRRYGAVNGTAMPLALSDNTANNRIVYNLTLSTSVWTATVVSGGATQVNDSVGAPYLMTYDSTVSRLAFGYQVSDFAFTANGSPTVADVVGAVPIVNQMELGAGPAASAFNGHIRRVTYWPTRLGDADLREISASGPGAANDFFDSGWVQAREMEFRDDEVPADWAAQYSPMQFFDGRTVRYGYVEFLDTAPVAIGRLFISGGFQPAVNASLGLKEGRIDFSSATKTISGKKYGTPRRRIRTSDFALDWLSQDEADELHEIDARVGTTEEILLIPWGADDARNQRYGGIGTLSELSAIDYPLLNVRRKPIRWEEKT